MGINTSKLEITHLGDQYIFDGVIDENTDLAKVEPISGTIAINLKKVTGINSIGCRHWIKFCEKYQECNFVYYEVSYEMMNAFAMLPALLKPRPSLGKIRSFFLSFSCLNCNLEFTALSNFKEIEVSGDEAYAPLKPCLRCGNPSTLLEEGSEFLYLFVDVVNQ